MVVFYVSSNIWHLINPGWATKFKFLKGQKWRMAPLVFMVFSTVFLQRCLSKSSAKESQTAIELLVLAYAGPLPQMHSLHCLLTNFPSSFKIQLKWLSVPLWNHSTMPRVRPIFHYFKLVHNFAHITVSSHSAPYRNSFCVILSSHLAYELPNHVDEARVTLLVQHHNSTWHRKKSSINIGRHDILKPVSLTLKTIDFRKIGKHVYLLGV